MLVIRNAQLEVLAFESKLYKFLKEHLFKYFPNEMTDRQESSVAFIEKSIANASKYGIEEGVGICKYMHLMILLGDSFDESSQNQWFMDILRNTDNGTPTERISQVATLVVFSRA